MMRYKMICLDIDGTVLNTKNEITPRTRAAVSAVSSMGIPVVLVSARMPKAMVFLRDGLGLDDPIACYGGGLILKKDGQTIESQTMEAGQVRKLTYLAGTMGLHVSFYRENDWYVEELDSWAKQEGRITHLMPAVCDTAVLVDQWEADGTGPHKLLFMAEPKLILAFMKKLEAKKYAQMAGYRSKDTYLEVMPKGVGKKETVAVLCRHYGISPDQILAVGDNDNDISMIQYAGMGVAMGNAHDEVKKHADYVTLTNDEDGVAYAIEKFVLDQ